MLFGFWLSTVDAGRAAKKCPGRGHWGEHAPSPPLASEMKRISLKVSIWKRAKSSEGSLTDHAGRDAAGPPPTHAKLGDFAVLVNLHRHNHNALGANVEVDVNHGRGDIACVGWTASQQTQGDLSRRTRGGDEGIEGTGGDPQSEALPSRNSRRWRGVTRADLERSPAVSTTVAIRSLWQRWA